MKKIIVFPLLLLLSAASFSQQKSPSPTLTKQDYLKKSKNQKTAAWVLLGGGAVLAGAGFLIGDSKESSFNDASTGAVIGGIGVLSMIGSIPLFIASAKNKKRGMSASAYFKKEDIIIPRGYGMVRSSFPALSVKINLR